MFSLLSSLKVSCWRLLYLLFAAFIFDEHGIHPISSGVATHFPSIGPGSLKMTRKMSRDLSGFLHWFRLGYGVGVNR